ncbi:unnamed protein product, partial [marine sediment metagenome]
SDPREMAVSPKKASKSLQVIGDWMKTNGASIYGTKASPFEKLSWGRCSQKSLPGGKTRFYLHVFDWPSDGKLIVPIMTQKVPTARRLADGDTLRVASNKEQVTIFVGDAMPDKIATVIELDVEGLPKVSHQ